MKPSFALNLSHDGLSLLRRTQDGWQNIGKVALDAPDLAEQLRILRQRAGDMATGPMTCKLIIPNSQILYRRLEVPGDSDTERTREAKNALDGLTPYALDDLAFDWADAGADMADVAAVARETLDEAESFASEHCFNPVSFVAIPEPEDFPREVYFGTTGVSETLLPPGQEVEPDISSIIVESPLPAEPEQDANPPPDWALVSASLLAREGVGSHGGVRDAAAETGNDDAAGEAGATPDRGQSDAFGTAQVSQPEQEPDDAVKPGGDSDDTAPLALETPLFSTRRETSPDEPEFTPTLENMEARFALYGDKTDRREEDTVSPLSPEVKAQQVEAADLAADLVATPAAPNANAHPRDAAKAGISVTAPGLVGDKVERIRLKKSRRLPRKKAPTPPLASAPGTPGSSPAIAPPKAAAHAKSAAPFGTRQAQIAQPPSARIGRLIGLGLAVVLLVAILVGSLLFDKPFAGKWLFGGNGAGIAPTEVADAPPLLESPPPQAPAKSPTDTPAQAPAQTPETTGAKATASAPPEPNPGAAAVSAPKASAPPPPAPVQVPPPTAAQTPTLNDGSTAETTDVASSGPSPEQPAAPQSTAPSAPTPEELAESGDAQEDTAAIIDPTGIWSQAPSPPVDLDTDRLENLYIASIDKRILSHDAIVLPRAMQPEVRPIVQTRPPPPPGTTFDLDARGLVRATPQGALSPDGIMVYAARPPVVPALRPGSAPLVEKPGEPAAQAAQLERLAKIRPVARPGNLVEQDERARLGGLSRSELARIRPVARPTSLQNSTANASLAPTERAVAQSLRPKPRPQGFSSAVEKALAEALANPPANDQTAAAVTAPRQPDIPTTASVAREATVKNAISLGSINLIGIYGSSSDRRALVRLKSGRYVKVKVGDRLDGGQVAEIGDGKLKYIKRGRTVTLEIAS